MSTSRRDFLKFAALLSGATGVAGFSPGYHLAIQSTSSGTQARPIIKATLTNAASASNPWMSWCCPMAC